MLLFDYDLTLPIWVEGNNSRANIQSGIGSLFISAGAAATIGGAVILGDAEGSSGTLPLYGQNSSLQKPSAFRVRFGGPATTRS